MRSAIGTAVACLSITAFSQVADAQVSSDSKRTEGSPLEEIVVTAQKREERLQDVPISISVLGGAALDSSSDRGVIEAVSRVPGVFVPQTAGGARYGGNSMIAIRGVSSPTVGSGTTGYYLDNVPYGLAQQAFAPDTNAYDLDRVEVLRGPQGTLYGANALNGVVRVLTKNPNLNDVEFKARASLSSTEHGNESYSGDAAFNMPIISEKLAARVVVGYQSLGGWIDKPNRDDANETEKTNARVKLAAQLTDKFSAGLSAWFSRIDNEGLSTSYDGGRTQVSLLREPNGTDFDIYNLDLNYDAGLFSIKSATSYIDNKIRGEFDGSYPPCFLCLLSTNGVVTLSNDLDSTVLAEEFVLSSKGDGPWRWTLGSMYRDAEDFTAQKVNIGVSQARYYVESKSIAVYGELTRAFADGRFELTGGLRYFRDEVHNWETSRSSLPNQPLPNGIPPGGLQSIEETFTKTTPRVVLTWHPSDAATLYASYSKGFRSGLIQGFDVSAAYPDLSPAKPDTLTNYEIGGKASFGRLNFETAVYYIDWEGAQQTTSVVVNGVNRPAFLNGDSVSGAGVDVALMYSPVDALTLGLNYGWNDLTYDAALYSGSILVAPKGDRRTTSPKTTAGASINYSVALGGSGYRGQLSGSANYTSGQIADILGTTNPATRFYADSMMIARASFAVEAPQNWTATLFADNVTDEDGSFPSANSAPYYTTVLRPRTYGVQFEYRY